MRTQRAKGDLLVKEAEAYKTKLKNLKMKYLNGLDPLTLLLLIVAHMELNYV